MEQIAVIALLFVLYFRTNGDIFHALREGRGRSLLLTSLIRIMILCIKSMNIRMLVLLLTVLCVLYAIESLRWIDISSICCLSVRTVRSGLIKICKS